MRNTMVPLLAACVTLASSHSAAVGDDQRTIDLGAAFQRASRMDGSAYQLARHYLMQKPEELVKIVREKSKSDNWRERDLARALLLRLTKPKEVELWDFVLLNYYQELKLLPDGTVNVCFPLSSKLVIDKRVPVEGIVVDRRSVPLLLEKLREIGPIARAGYYETQMKALFTMLKHFADPGSANAVTDYFFRYQLQNDLLDDLLVTLGERTVAPLREAVKSAPLTTGCLRLLIRNTIKASSNAPPTAATVPISARDIAKPGTSESSRMTDPNTKAMMPPRPSTPKLGAKASAIINTTPRRISARPA